MSKLSVGVVNVYHILLLDFSSVEQPWTLVDATGPASRRHVHGSPMGTGGMAGAAYLWFPNTSYTSVSPA
jgi:hypothetical protein